jgi:hypothetical protein
MRARHYRETHDIDLSLHQQKLIAHGLAKHARHLLSDKSGKAFSLIWMEQSAREIT